jgi:hypothetical protein
MQRMRFSRLGGPFVLALATLLTSPLAAAIRPDQTWIVGIYDAADLDDLVTLIADLCASGKGHTHELSPPSCLRAEVICLEHLEHGRVGSHSSARGPPEGVPPVVISSAARLAAPPLYSADPTLPHCPPSDANPVSLDPKRNERLAYSTSS